MVGLLILLTRELASRDADSSMVAPIHPELATLVPGAPIENLHTVQDVRFPSSTNHDLLSQECHMGIGTGSLKGSKGLPPVHFCIIELCGGQVTYSIKAACDIDAFLPLKDVSMTSVGMSFLQQARPSLPFGRAAC